MTYRDRHLERAILRMEKNDAALSYVLRQKMSLARFGASQIVTPVIRESFEYYSKLLKDIPEGLTCECCGFKNLVNVRRMSGRVLGPECSKPGHPFGSCKRERA